jgi:hypothetical protein
MSIGYIRIQNKKDGPIQNVNTFTEVMIMRIAAQVLNESAKKAGLPIGNMSLLNGISEYDQSTGSAGASDNNPAVTSFRKNSYEHLESSANSLEAVALEFTSELEENLFAQARENGNVQEVKEKAKSFVSNYNDTLKRLGRSDSTLNNFYKQMLESAYSENEEELSGIGITADRNGYLSMDESKFDAADTAAMEKALGSSSAFTTKTGYIASRVANNAESYLESMSSVYSIGGQNISSYLNHQIDLQG